MQGGAGESGGHRAQHPQGRAGGHRPGQRLAVHPHLHRGAAAVRYQPDHRAVRHPHGHDRAGGLRAAGPPERGQFCPFQRQD